MPETGDSPPGSGDPWIDLIDRAWSTNPLSRLLPLDPGEIARSLRAIWLDAESHPGRALAQYEEFARESSEVAISTMLRLWGADAPEPVVQPEPGDRRFAAPDWQRNAAFDAIRQTYLLTARHLLRAASSIEGLDERAQRKLVFYVRQFADAISPTNVPFTNPDVIHEAIATGGRSLVAGAENLARDLRDGQIRMTDPDAFAPGRNLATTPGQVVFRNRLIELIQYAPATETVRPIPLVFIPPWINKFYILDLQPRNSLLRFLVEQGYTVFVISWKNPDASMEDTTFDDYMTLGPLAAFDVAREISGAARVNAVGYCIGGTLLAMALPYLAATGADVVNAATFLVSLVDFAEVGDTAVFVDEPQVAYIEQQMLERGYLDSRDMAAMFNMLRANDLIWSNVVNNYLLGKDAPAFDLLYWNADGTRMARAAHSFYLRNTYLENNLVEPGKLALNGVPIDVRKIEQDVYAVGTEQDHIVPWKAAWQLTRLVGGKSRFALGGSGHIAGVIDPPSKGRGYRTKDGPARSPDEWLAGSEHHDGSWWTDWVKWLDARSGERVAPPPLGGTAYPPLCPAPGTYVLEK